MARKSLKEEIQVIKYMTDLAGPTFEYLKGMYAAGDKEDKKWAVEQMMKLYSKAIPTELTTDPDNPLQINLISYANNSGQVSASPVSDSNTSSI